MARQRKGRRALRAERGLPWLLDLGRDLRLAARTIRKRPAFYLTAILTLAIGIAASSVVFAVLKAVLLTPLPFRSPDDLVLVADSDTRAANADRVSFATARDLLHRTDALERLSLFDDTSVRPILGGGVEQLRGMRVSTDFFETLGVPMYLGRPFRSDEGMPGADRVLILTHGAWRDLFAADPAVVGRSIPTIYGDYLVIGILGPDFHPLAMTNPAELPRVFTPLAFTAAQRDCRACRGFRAIGRLAPGVTRGIAEARLAAAMRALAAEHPADYSANASARITPLRDQVIGRFGMSLWLLQAAVLLLLVLACANVATLLLARTIPRQREMAVRSALGAGRGRLIRQMLTESAMLAAAAGAAGMALAWFVIRVLAQTGTAIPRIGELVLDPAVLVFTVMVSAATTVGFGLPPATLDASGAAGMLRLSESDTGHRARRRLVQGLIAGELALGFVLVMSVALLGKSYVRLMKVDLGFDPENVLTLSLLPDGVHYPSQASRLAYFDAVVERVRTVPGVQTAGYASTLPLSHPFTVKVSVREHPLINPANAASLDRYLVSAEFLDIMKIPILHGRGFTREDGPGAERVALVSASAARTQFPGEDPLAKHIRLGDTGDPRAWATIVGVVGDVHQYALDRPADAAVYLLFSQAGQAQGWSSLVIRSSVPPEKIESAVRAAMIAVDPLQPIFHMQPMSAYIALSLAQRTFTLALIAVFGGLGLALAAGGVYGVVSYVVAQRTREVGVRFALGATRGAVTWMLVREVLMTSAVGLAIGLFMWTALTRALSALLFDVSRLDPGVMLQVLLLLLAAALAASGLPVMRAARIDPAIALRAE